MSKRISLFGRKRIGELLNGVSGDPADLKRNELLAIKMAEINDSAAARGEFQYIPLRQLVPDPNQPRKTFRNLEALTESIKEKGIIQPIIVAKQVINGCHQIIAGERRYHAAKRAGLKEVPCVLREEADANILLLQLLENDQRDDVSPLEEADAVARLLEQFSLSKGEIAQALGRDAAWVSLRLGLQKAPEKIKALVREGLIEDLRTLHELRMMEETHAQTVDAFIEQVRKNQISGSYRQVIALMRKDLNEQALDSGKSVKKVKPRVKTVRKLEKVENQLLVHTGGKHPVVYQLPGEVLVAFLATVTYE